MSVGELSLRRKNFGGHFGTKMLVLLTFPEYEILGGKASEYFLSKHHSTSVAFATVFLLH